MNARGGIDLGGTKIQAAVVSGRHEVLGEARVPTPSEGPPQIAEAMAAALAEASQAAALEPETLEGVGVGAPGEVDAAAGTVARSGNLAGWDDPFPLADTLSRALGTAVVLGNDVQVATDAEARLGAGRGFDSLLGVFWGTGVGGGLILGGEAWHGRGAAGEIGHVVVKRGGARCPCGRRGCLEAYAGRGSMERRARKLAKKGRKTKLFEIMESRGRDRLTSGIWERALKQDDKLAAKLLERAVKALGAGIASAVNVLDVEAVVIGGGLGVRFGEQGAARIEEAMAPHVFTSDNPPVVRVAALGDLGGAIGASLLVEGDGSAERGSRA